MIDLFDDLLDDDSTEVDEIGSELMKGFIKTVALDFYIHYTNFHNVYLTGKIYYKIVDNYIFFSDINGSVNQTQFKVDNILSPVDEHDIVAIIKFNDNYKGIDYIYSLLYLSGSDKNFGVYSSDREFFLVLFCNDLFEKQGLIVHNLFYSIIDVDKPLTRFDISLFTERRDGEKYSGLTERFCKVFPLIKFVNGPQKLSNRLHNDIAGIIRFDRIGFESETAFLEMCKRLYKLYPNILLEYNLATTFFHNNAFYQPLTKFDNTFVDIVLKQANGSINDIDTCMILNKDLILSNKVNECKVFNKIRKNISRYL